MVALRLANCAQCGLGFTPENIQRRYCSRLCRDKARSARYKKHTPPAPLVATVPGVVPPKHLRMSHDLMDYAPNEPHELAGWFRALPAHQLKAVWVALVVEQFEGGAALAECLRVVRGMYERVESEPTSEPSHPDPSFPPPGTTGADELGP